MTKIAFWIIGVGCASKSLYAKKLAEKLDVHAIHLDCIRDRLRDGFTLEDEYKDTHDIVISTSMIHYIKDKEKFIRECARITQEQFILECPLSKLDGLVLEQDPERYDLFFPSMDLIKYWLGKYFNEFEIVGESPTEDNSYRIIFKAIKWKTIWDS